MEVRDGKGPNEVPDVREELSCIIRNESVPLERSHEERLSASHLLG